MVRSRAVLLATAVAAVALAGCLGGDDAPEPGETSAAEAVATREAGAVTGQMLTVGLDIVRGVEVALVNRTGGVEVTTTDGQGRYTFNEVSPGPYRVQIDAPCCRATTVAVDVPAGEVIEVSLMLEFLTERDLAQPFVVEEEWEGFISCDVSLFSAGLDLCGNTPDPNHDSVKSFEVEEALEEIVLAMIWDENTAAGDVYGNALGLHLYNEDCETCGHRYIREDKSSPIVVFLNDDDIDAPEQEFANIDGTLGMRYDVYSGGTNVVYQQAFTMYWYEFYHKRSPVDFSPFPGET